MDQVVAVNQERFSTGDLDDLVHKLLVCYENLPQCGDFKITKTNLVDTIMWLTKRPDEEQVHGECRCHVHKVTGSYFLCPFQASNRFYLVLRDLSFLSNCLSKGHLDDWLKNTFEDKKDRSLLVILGNGKIAPGLDDVLTKCQLDLQVSILRIKDSESLADLVCFITRSLSREQQLVYFHSSGQKPVKVRDHCGLLKLWQAQWLVLQANSKCRKLMPDANAEERRTYCILKSLGKEVDRDEKNEMLEKMLQ